MARDQDRQTDRFAGDVFPKQPVASRRGVPLVEHQIQAFKHRVESGGQFFGGSGWTKRYVVIA